MPNSEQPAGRDNGIRQPTLLARGERRRIERRLQEVGVLCQPEVSLQFQAFAKRAVLRGVESGGAAKEIGRYVTFCDEKGERIPWLQPIDSVGVNGRHAVVIGPTLISVETFRVRNTYDVLIVKYEALQTTQGRRGRIEAKALFRGRQGHLPLDLTGDAKGMAGNIVPEFFNKAGERVEIPPEFVEVLKATVQGANCVGCTHQHYLTAPKAEPRAIADGVIAAPADEPVREPELVV
jgi:hypothetical protein